MADWELVKPLFPDQYTYSKNTNFALIFLGTPWTLAYNTGRDANDPEQLEECKRHFEDWYELYPEIPIYQRHMIDHGYEHGWVPTLGGRRGHVRKMLEGCDRNGKYIEDDEKRKKMIKHGERVCTNTPAQGSEADIVKMALNLIANDPQMIELRAAPLFPVHDEVVVEAPERTSAPALDRQIVLMKEPYKDKMLVPLAVEGAFGDNWLTAKP
jgi:DNA polymerase-1